MTLEVHHGGETVDASGVVAKEATSHGSKGAHGDASPLVLWWCMGTETRARRCRTTSHECLILLEGGDRRLLVGERCGKDRERGGRGGRGTSILYAQNDRRWKRKKLRTKNRRSITCGTLNKEKNRIRDRGCKLDATFVRNLIDHAGSLCHQLSGTTSNEKEKERKKTDRASRSGSLVSRQTNPPSSPARNKRLESGGPARTLQPAAFLVDCPRRPCSRGH